MSRQDIRFESDGVQCAGWFYQAQAEGACPCVVMAHGLAAIKEMGLAAYAERFAQAGYHVLVFDYRHFGESGGEPRQLLDIQKQQRDWHAAIRYARQHDQVDEKQIVLWGTSLSGGHVMAVAAGDAAVAAVISQVPHAHGLGSGLAGGLIHSLRLTIHGLWDALGALAGRDMHTINAVGKPGELALLAAPGDDEGYMRLLPDGQAFDKRMAARFVLSITTYSPGKYLRNLAMPVLMQVAQHDTSTPAYAAVKAAQNARTVTIKFHSCTHFDPYVEPLFDTIIAEQLEFLAAR